MNDMVTISRDQAEAILNVLYKFDNECDYQLNESPFEHDEEGQNLWLHDREECLQEIQALEELLGVNDGNL
jgi:hypothetical protein